MTIQSRSSWQRSHSKTSGFAQILQFPCTNLSPTMSQPICYKILSNQTVNQAFLKGKLPKWQFSLDLVDKGHIVKQAVLLQYYIFPVPTLVLLCHNTLCYKIQWNISTLISSYCFYLEKINLNVKQIWHWQPFCYTVHSGYFPLHGSTVKSAGKVQKQVENVPDFTRAP